MNLDVSSKIKMKRQHFCKWTVDDVRLWLRQNSLGEYEDLLCDTHRIDGTVLQYLSEEDLRKPPVSMNCLGDMKRFLILLSDLKSSSDNYDCDCFCYVEKIHISPNRRCNSSLKSIHSTEDDDIPIDGDEHRSFTTDNPHAVDPRKLSPLEEEIRNAVVSEPFRTAVSIIYAFSVFLLASFTLAVVHDRLPDTENFPPLPDVFLENIPVIPWAFDLCEICGCIMLFFWVLIIIFHKHRLVVIRRSCAIAGTIFLLRCFTMYVTSLSVPGKHLKCSPTKYGTFYNRAMRAVEIFKGAGMAVQGVRTCGDYMFSGHTATLTLLNFFVTEYTPRRWYFLHTVCWLLNIFGIFFILASHEHYSIDVLISFYISSRLFMYYHTLASSVHIRTSDERRRRVWFPLFWFFEYGCPLIVPNDFEWPFTMTTINNVIFQRRNENAVKEKKL